MLLSLIGLTILFGILAIALHEFGHWSIGRLVGLKTHLKFSKKPFQFVIWFESDEDLRDEQLRAFGQAGFVIELLGLFPLLMIDYFCLFDFTLLSPLYFAIVLLHFALYPWYNRFSNVNDFRYLNSYPQDSD